jgi:hypothetical protein
MQSFNVVTIGKAREDGFFDDRESVGGGGAQQSVAPAGSLLHETRFVSMISKRTNGPASGGPFPV